MALSHTRLDLGEGPPGEQLQGAFTVTNRGTQPLEFKLSASCGCAFVRPMAGTLGAGESRSIALGIRLPGTINSEKSTQVIVHTNDPRQPQVALTATARAPAPWEVSATHINFGYVLREELARAPPRQQIIVRPGKGKNALPTSVIRVEMPGDAYEVRTRRDTGDSLVIEVSLRPVLADGRYTSTLHLGHAEDPAAIGIALTAEVGPAVTLVPAQVRLVRDERTGGYRHGQVIVLARRPGLLIGPVRAIAWPRGISLQDAGPRRARMRRVVVHVEAGVDLPEAALQLPLEVADVNERLVLPLVFAGARAGAAGPAAQALGNQEN